MVWNPEIVSSGVVKRLLGKTVSFTDSGGIPVEFLDKEIQSEMGGQQEK